MLAAGLGEPLSHQHEHAVGQPRLAPRRAACELVQDGFHPQLPPQLAQGQHAPPRRCLLGGQGVGGDIAALRVEQPQQGVELGAQQVFASEADDDPLAGAALLVAVGLGELDVLVEFARGAAEGGEAGEHGLWSDNTIIAQIQASIKRTMKLNRTISDNTNGDFPPPP